MEKITRRFCRFNWNNNNNGYFDEVYMLLNESIFRIIMLFDQLKDSFFIISILGLPSEN